MFICIWPYGKSIYYIFYFKRTCSSILTTALYANGFLLDCSQLVLLLTMSLKLSNSFRMKDLKESHLILGIDIIRKRSVQTIIMNKGNILRGYNIKLVWKLENISRRPWTLRQGMVTLISKSGRRPGGNGVERMLAVSCYKC